MMKVSELIQEFVDEIDRNSVLHSPGQVTRLCLRFKPFLQAFGDRDIDGLTREEITNWLKPLSGDTHRSQLVSLFRHGIQRGYLSENPAFTPPQKPPRTGFLTTKAIDA
jgi:hypothetical protein